MTMTTNPSADLLPAEVRQFAEQWGVAELLPEVMNLTRRIFPSATRFDVVMDEDPDVAGDRHIVFELEAPLGIEESLDCDARWIDGLYRILSAPLVPHFRLSLHLVQ